MDYGGRPRKLIVHPGRTGFVYVLDRETGELLSAETYQPTNWASGYDLKTGKAARGSRQADALRHRHAGHLSVVDRRQGRHPVGVLAAHRSALHPRAQHLHGLRRHRGQLHRRHAVPRRRREDVSGSRRVSGRARRVGRRAQPQGLGRQGRQVSRSTAACSPPAATSSSTGRWTDGSRRWTRRTGTELWKFHVASGIVGKSDHLSRAGRQAVRRGLLGDRRLDGRGGVSGHLRRRSRTPRSAWSAR